MPLPHRRAGLAVLVAMIAAGCGGIVDPSQRTTDTKNGVVRIGDSSTETFNVSKRGEVDVKLNKLTPTFADPLALYFGQQISGQCQFGSAIPIRTGQDIPLTSYALFDPGTYCVALAAVPSMTADESYSIDIVHP